MRVVKAVIQPYCLKEDLSVLFSNFRRMTNYCIKIGVEKNITSRNGLSREVYKTLGDAREGLHSWYVLGAIERASGILKNYRSAVRKALKKGKTIEKPFVRKDFIILGNQAFKIEDKKLKMHLTSKSFIEIPLNSYTLKKLNGVKIGELILKSKSLSISYSKEVEFIKTVDVIGVDRNLSNITTASNQKINVYDFKKITEMKNVYRKVKSHFKRNDVRVRRKVFGKYGLKQKRKENQALHVASKKLVEEAFKDKSKIVFENIKGIRKLYKKGNGQGKKYRAKLNGWSFSKIALFTQYKANWLGLPVGYVDARNTSNLCAVCGSRVTECAGRMVLCELF
ncbi:MAG: IS200/IS605 family accessory protein TnpB-related protein [Candidatus Marsarchaeota archaeon]|nr:IS200/IS605 family accessory protein TnpB-related protein [Candidatus Marsarchaeota archaeon]